MSDVIWKFIKGYEGVYEISNDGDIRRVLKNKYRILSRSNINNQGYRQVTLSKNNKQKNYRVHRLLAETFLKGDNCKNLTVNHIDGNKLNNSLNNLEWVTSSENLKHSFKIGLSKNLGGENAKNVKLTKLQFQSIINELESGAKGVFIQKKYNISSGTVSEIKNNVNYRKSDREL
jgi:hypothetical protein